MVASLLKRSAAGLASENSAARFTLAAAGKSVVACPHDDVLVAKEIAGSNSKYLFFIVLYSIVSLLLDSIKRYNEHRSSAIIIYGYLSNITLKLSDQRQGRSARGKE
jgi:hypothetical protein